MRVLNLAASALFCALSASSQEQQVFHFQNLDSAPAMQQAVNIVRTVGAIQNVDYDAAAKTVNVQGSEADLALAQWLFRQLDQAPGNRESAALNLPGSGEAIKIFYLANTRTVQDLQDAVNGVRAVFELPRVFPLTSSMAVVVRTSPQLMGATDWLLSKLDLAASPRTASDATLATASAQLPVSSAGDIVSVTYLQPEMSRQQFQETTNAVRVVPELVRVFPQFRLRAIVVKTSPERTAAASWLMSELDGQARANAAPQEFQMAQAQPSLLRVFPLNHTETNERFLRLTNTIRTTTKITRLFPCATSKIIALRGTEEQVAQVEKLVQQLDVAR